MVDVVVSTVAWRNMDAKQDAICSESIVYHKNDKNPSAD